MGLIGGPHSLWTNPAGPNSAMASPPPDGSGAPNEPTLKQKLADGLETRAPAEIAFIKKVVSLVNDGTLPESLVDSTFDWARKKEKHKFQYFRQALIVRAKQMGIQM